MQPTKIRKAILPVAGLGTRFLPATKAQPKEMLPLVDKPVIQFLIEEAAEAGIEEVIFVTGKGKRAIEDHFDTATELERALEQKGKRDMRQKVHDISDMVKVTYVRQREARGDGDALLAAAHLIGDEPVAILFGDDIVINKKKGCLRQMTEEYEQTQTPILCLEKVPKSQVDQYGIVEAKKAGDRRYHVRRLLEKPDPEETTSRLGVVGKYIITPDVWDHLMDVQNTKKTGEIRLADALGTYLEEGHRVSGYAFLGERFDCGSKAGFLKATVRLGLEHEETKKELRRYLRSLNF